MQTDKRQYLKCQVFALILCLSMQVRPGRLYGVIVSSHVAAFHSRNCFEVLPVVGISVNTWPIVLPWQELNGLHCRNENWDATRGQLSRCRLQCKKAQVSHRCCIPDSYISLVALLVKLLCLPFFFLLLVVRKGRFSQPWCCWKDFEKKILSFGTIIAQFLLAPQETAAQPEDQAGARACPGDRNGGELRGGPSGPCTAFLEGSHPGLARCSQRFWPPRRGGESSFPEADAGG